MLPIRVILFSVIALIVSSSLAYAAELIGEYRAFISENDLYNSSGKRLTEPWQIVRQDRANYHQFGVRDRDDQYDDFFALKRNRELLERLIRQGTIDPSAGKAVLRGNAYIRVKIYGSGSRGDYVNVFVEEGESQGGNTSKSPNRMSSLAEMFSNVDVELDWFMSQYGPPKFKHSEGGRELMQYEIQDCGFMIQAADGKVKEVSIFIERGKCDVQYGDKWVSDLTLGDFYVESDDGQWQSSCIDCGNAADPQVSYVVRGKHASGYVDVVVSTYENIWKLEQPLRAEVGVSAFDDMSFDLSRFDNLLKDTLRDSPISDYGLGKGLFK